MNVIRIHPEEVDYDMLRIKTWLTGAVARGHGEMEVSDYIDWLKSGKFQGWAITDGHYWIGFCITEIVEYPRITVCRIVSLAGLDMFSWKDLLHERMQQFAKEQGCKRIETVARPGFFRALRHLGVKVMYWVISQEVK